MIKGECEGSIETERSGSAGSLENKEQVNSATLSEARTVLRVLPELAGKILAGREPSNLAYEKAVKQRGEAKLRAKA